MLCCEPYIFEKFYSAIITVKTIPFLPSHGAKVEPSRLCRCAADCLRFSLEQRPLFYGLVFGYMDLQIYPSALSLKSGFLAGKSLTRVKLGKSHLCN